MREVSGRKKELTVGRWSAEWWPVETPHIQAVTKPRLQGEL